MTAMNHPPLKYIAQPLHCYCCLCSTFKNSTATKVATKMAQKWNMGRQIAQVMSQYGLEWLERPEREIEENTIMLLKILGLKSGMHSADIGAGSGYNTRMLSTRIRNRKVYAEDIEPEMIACLKQKIKKEKLSNISKVLGTEKSVSLPTESMDIMLLIDVYHEFSFPY
jgi:ubiquinone/menaquinone biosynthesis C-methylase UbiE